MRDDRLEVLLSREQVAERVLELADTISRDYEGKNLLLICVLKGAVIFAADLIRHMRIPLELDFVAASSYQGQSSSGDVKLSRGPSGTLRGKDILIIEDIIDTGLTCRSLIDHFAEHKASSLRLCTLLDKPSERRNESVQPDYVGFTIPDKFVVGYGLDYEEKYRELRDICVLKA